MTPVPFSLVLILKPFRIPALSGSCEFLNLLGSILLTFVFFSGSLGVLFLLTLFKLLHLFRHLFTLDHKKSGYRFMRLELSMLRDGTLYFFLIFSTSCLYPTDISNHLLIPVATLLTMVSDLSPDLGYFNDLWHP